MSFTYPHYQSLPIPDRRAVPVVVVGGGLVGLTLALDLARQGVPVRLIDDDDTVSVGSRAICFSKRTLEIYDRLGLGGKFLEKGITWNRGKVFFRKQLIYEFDLLPESGHHYPAFVNLQQYYAEAWLVEACAAAGVELYWRHRLTGLDAREDGVRLSVSAPEGDYDLEAEWVLACDGARSQVRECLGLGFTGKVFNDRFLIADVEMEADFPTERWFWFDPPFHPGQSVLLHRQADNVWRIDFQLGPDADPEEERKPERVIPRIRAMLGARPFRLEWVSVYTFRCRRLERFRHGRVIFAGDAAHQVSPFGARGGNGGVQDADNLAWKLAALLRGEASPALLDTYDAERIPAADENILHSTRSTDFISPKGEAMRAFRDATLLLAARHPFARRLVNSGRLSTPAILEESPLNDPAASPWPGCPPLGAPAIDAPLTARSGQRVWLLDALQCGFTLLALGPLPEDEREALGLAGITAVTIGPEGELRDEAGLFAARYGRVPGYLFFRPDQHLAGAYTRYDRAHLLALKRWILAGGRLSAPAPARAAAEVSP
jgi:3-(3-hydroxy-phenyl)propionate hydroxylase